MGIEIDFLSVTLGYIIGVLLTWSLCFTIYGNEDEQKTTNNGRYLYSGIRHGDGRDFDYTFIGNRPTDG